MRSKLITLLFFIFIGGPVTAQRFATKLIGLNDTTVEQFTDVNELYFLHQWNNGSLQKLVKQLSVVTSQAKANKIIEKIAMLKSPESAIVLVLTDFFNNRKPTAGTNVELVINRLRNSDHYNLVNKYYLQNSIDKSLPAEQYCKKILDTLGWRLGYAAFYYLSPQDSVYLSKMKQVDVSDIDTKVEKIINRYLKQQRELFVYDRKSILNEVLAIDKVKDAQWDDCLIKIDVLPFWDKLGILITDGKDTVERVYSVQYSKFKYFRLGKHLLFPLKSNPDILWYQAVDYGLHFIANTRQQCEENQRMQRESYGK